MSRIIAYPGKEINLIANVFNCGRELVDQPVGYPKVSIKKIVSGVPTVLLADTVMVEDIAGEYLYAYTIPAVTEANSALKVKYKVMIDGIETLGYDTVDVFDLRMFLNQFNVKKTFSYNPDQSVSTVLLAYGSPVVKQLQLSFTYNGDKSVDEMDIVEL